MMKRPKEWAFFTGDVMSAIDLNRNEVVVGGVGNVVAKFASVFTGWNDRRATRVELNRLSDRELDDIGLCRGDIERVVRGL